MSEQKLSKNARRRLEKRTKPLITTVSGVITEIKPCPPKVRVCNGKAFSFPKRLNGNRLAAFELKVTAEGKRLTAYISSTLRERAQRELRIDGNVSLTLQRFYDKDCKPQFEVLNFTAV